MSRLDVMQHALDEQRKDERRKESEALHQIKWHRINLRRPRPAAKVFVPVADSDADFEMLRARVAALRLVQRRLQAEATVLTCELASVDGVGATARRTQLTNRSSLWHLADDLDRSLVAEQRATLDGALGEVEEEGEEAEEEPRYKSLNKVLRNKGIAPTLTLTLALTLAPTLSLTVTPTRSYATRATRRPCARRGLYLPWAVLRLYYG